MSLGGGTFEAVFDAVPCGALIQFHVRAATDQAIPIRFPINAPCDSLVTVAANASTVVLEDGLEVATGWIVGAPGDDATHGVWTRVDPVGTDSQPETDHTPNTEGTCFVTGQGAVNGNLGDNDVDSGVTTLISPVLDLSGHRQATIAYWRWFHNSFSQIDQDEGNAPNEDVFEVWITDDGGMTWVLVETVGPAGPETAGGWFLHAFDAGQLVTLTDQVRLRFVASDVGGLSIVEAAVDDLLVVGVNCQGMGMFQRRY